MAEVWLADRVDGAFERQVAIKLLFNHPSRSQRASFAERFRRERDILAALAHRNIARLEDAGVTAGGQPWLALEYVQGEPITGWCDCKRTHIEARIAVFRQVLLAVEFAHANLVILSLSVSCGEAPGKPPWQGLPVKVGPVETIIREAVLADGITVVAAAGNGGERAFPGQMKPVIAVGGVFADEGGALKASNFASAFTSKIYANRKVPDVCGLCGEGVEADFIMLPVPPGSKHDRRFGVFDGTGKQDGWARFSGTSAAAPQVAGVCALLLQKSPNLTPKQVKSLLVGSAVDVKDGLAAAVGGAGALGAAAGADGATGAGLVDASAALALA